MMGQARVFGVVFRGQLYRRIGTKPHRRADGSVTQLAICPVSAVPANASGLPDQVCDESAGEAHHKDGCGYHEDQVDGPRVIAFAHKVDVSSATFVSIDVKVHSSGLRQGLLHAEYHLLWPSWGGIGAPEQNKSRTLQRAERAERAMRLRVPAT